MKIEIMRDFEGNLQVYKVKGVGNKELASEIEKAVNKMLNENVNRRE